MLSGPIRRWGFDTQSKNWKWCRWGIFNGRVSTGEDGNVNCALPWNQRMRCGACWGLIYKSTKSNEEKAAFTTNLQRTNTEREKAKLKPLDWCSDKFDKGWATENTDCAARVTRYEAGDTSALTP
jgi:hypothetical protein